ncbi:hypothetical protein NA57DRAFT_61798 [Rhizodiscina lignyota]|uniref:F-box domain-containing protein n=1 Tax=Rhizodiscina lignyota TaxID=1504668 RepID=A0A9P4I7Q5_9PEZI|nr:hypothetical protein NA57DRAFT_61798 [Rhizodiscina lignyota]
MFSISTPTSTFLHRLPLELRQEIYTHASRADTVTEFGPTIYLFKGYVCGFRNCINWAQVCRQIRDEYLPIFMRQNHFTLAAYWDYGFSTNPLYPRPTDDILRTCDFCFFWMQATQHYHQHFRSVCVWLHGPFAMEQNSKFGLQFNVNKNARSFDIFSRLPSLTFETRWRLTGLLSNHDASVPDLHRWRPNYIALFDNQLSNRFLLGWDFWPRSAEGLETVSYSVKDNFALGSTELISDNNEEWRKEAPSDGNINLHMVKLVVETDQDQEDFTVTSSVRFCPSSADTIMMALCGDEQPQVTGAPRFLNLYKASDSEPLHILSPDEA